MSHQPSTIDQVKDNASSAYESIAKTVSPTSQKDAEYDPNKDKNNFAKDTHGNVFKKGDFKDKLNEAATSGLQKEQPAGTFVEKVLSYVPGTNASKQAQSQGGTESPLNPEEPPKRPEHDAQVEHFLRKQYHSAAGDGMPDPGKN